MPTKQLPRILPIRSIMTENVITVSPDTLILDAVRLLPQHKISGVPVVDNDNNLVGILTEKDVLKVLNLDKITYEDTVSKFMTKNVVSFSEDDSAIEICHFFQRNTIRRVPIVRDGKLIGIVSRRDIITLILEAKSHLASYRFS